MDMIQAQEFFAQMYPGKKVDYTFDKECHRQIELIMTDGKPNPYHHIECHHVKVSPEGLPSFRVPIKPHRLTVDLQTLKTIFNDVFQ